MSGWRPIKSAPVDGTILLLGWWREWPKTEWVMEVSMAGNVDNPFIHPGSGHLHGQATHWMPLPDPPE